MSTVSTRLCSQNVLGRLCQNKAAEYYVRGKKETKKKEEEEKSDHKAQKTKNRKKQNSRNLIVLNSGSYGDLQWPHLPVQHWEKAMGEESCREVGLWKVFWMFLRIQPGKGRDELRLEYNPAPCPSEHLSRTLSVPKCQRWFGMSAIIATQHGDLQEFSSGFCKCEPVLCHI